MHAGVAHVALELLGKLQRLAHQRVGAAQLLAEFRHVLEAVLEVCLVLLAVLVGGHVVGDELGQAVRLGHAEALDTGHVLDGHLGGHGAVGDDVRHLFGAVVLGDVAQHVGASVVVEVDVDIGQRDTVGIEETLEQQVVLDGVNLRDAQAVGHARAGSGAAAGADADAELVAGDVDEILHDKEVAGEAHRLHDVQLELYALLQLGRQRRAVTALGALVGQL